MKKWYGLEKYKEMENPMISIFNKNFDHLSCRSNYFDKHTNFDTTYTKNETTYHSRKRIERLIHIPAISPKKRFGKLLLGTSE